MCIRDSLNPNLTLIPFLPFDLAECRCTVVALFIIDSILFCPVPLFGWLQSISYQAHCFPSLLSRHERQLIEKTTKCLHVLQTLGYGIILKSLKISLCGFNSFLWLNTTPSKAHSWINRNVCLRQSDNVSAHSKVSSIHPVSYTHLTLPTKRIV